MKTIIQSIQGIINLIKKYDYIIIYHHKFPDLDTLGAQYGLAQWIKDNFSHKNVHIYTKTQKIRIFNEYDNDIFNFDNKKILGICVDTYNVSRIEHGEEIINISEMLYVDHHKIINLDNINKNIKNNNYYIMDNEPATCQLLAKNFFNLENNFLYSQKCANYLFFGIITDTNRFMNNNTNEESHLIIANMYKKNIPIYSNYLEIYNFNHNDAKLYGHIMVNFIKKGKFAYFIQDEKILDKYSVSFETGKSFVNAMRNIDDIDIFILVTKYKDENLISISIRSLHKPVNLIANKYNGGGHSNAAGIKLDYNDDKKLNDILDEFNHYANK